METNGRRYLDRGAQGRVYHLEEQNIVLKKSINWKNSRLYDLAKNECRLLQELRHQNIVHFVDCEEREVPNENIVVFYLKMEYCCHGSLKRVLKNPTFIYSVATIVSWMENIFSALAFLAEHHKIHRDIKADNIMVDASFTLKLGDFGSVKETEKTAFDSIFGGTPGYMAPEVCKERKFSHRSDIFSVGKVLKEIVERRLLHEDKSSSNFGTSKDLDFVLTVCPKEIKELITCCTKENYQQRKSAAELLLEIPILRKHQPGIRLTGEGHKAELFSSFPSIAVDIKETILWLPIGLNGENDRHAVYKDENFYVPSVSSFPLNLPAFEEYDDPRNVIYEITLAAKNEKEILSFAKSLSLDTMIPQFYYPHKIRKDIERFLNSLATDLRFQFPFSNRILDFHNTENVKLQSLVSQMDEKNLESFASNLQMLIDGAKNLQYVYSYDYVSQKNFDLYTEMIDENLAAEFTDFSAESFKIPDFQIPDFLNVSQINDGKSDENLTYEYVAKQLDHILRRDYATQHFVYSSIFETLLELNSAELNSTEFIQPYNVKFLNKAFQIRTRSVINFKNDYKLYYVISTEMIIHLLQEEISCFQEEEKGRRKVEEKAPEHTDLAGDKAHEAKESTKETTKQYAQQAGRKLSNAAEKPPEMLKNFEDFWRNLQLHDLNGQKKRIK
ncbi:unnamed protein product, partial [Mesorhabditis belari]|uniref:Protein kinase domain-containing protein n=1 Tax=Mesorhabditis belari TaxID=2138241 RepID=A0AAF3FBD3_9BILA